MANLRKGDRVIADRMPASDEWVRKGDTGVVLRTDLDGTVFVRWDNPMLPQCMGGWWVAKRYCTRVKPSPLQLAWWRRLVGLPAEAV